MMRSAEQISQHIKDAWTDAFVARWVLDQLELLSLEKSGSIKAPVHYLEAVAGCYYWKGAAPQYFETPKLVISGGFEGTRGHVDVLHGLREAAAIMGGNFVTTVLLEPDSYISNVKRRHPLVSQVERAALWSATGLVDLVICLPDKPDSENWEDRYNKISRLLGEYTAWCTTAEHPSLVSVLTRPGRNAINLPQLLPETPSIHASFLAATKSMREEEFYQKLIEYEEELLSRFR